MTSAANAPEFSSGSRVPQWMLPGVGGETLHALRSNALRIANAPSAGTGPPHSLFRGLSTNSSAIAVTPA